MSGGDHAYDPTNFATKVRSVGVWFDGYDNTLLSETPRIYLFSSRHGCELVPDSLELDTREWTVVDQKNPCTTTHYWPRLKQSELGTITGFS